MTTVPSLSVVIVSFNAKSFLRNCLTSVLAQQPSFAFEVIVVDNASTDGTPSELVKEFPAVHWIQNASNKGFAYANNQGIQMASAGTILLLNPDTILQGDVFQPMMDFLDRTPEAGVIGPKIFNADGTLQRTGVSFPSAWNLFCETFFLDMIFAGSRVFGRHRKLYADPEKVQVVDYLQGSCLFIRRGAIDAAGPLDEAFHLYFEETDLCKRINDQGWRVLYVPLAAIVHFGGSGMGYYDEYRLAQFHRSALTYFKKHYSSPRQVILRFLLLLRSAVRAGIFALGVLLFPGRRNELASRMRGYIRSMRIVAGVVK